MGRITKFKGKKRNIIHLLENIPIYFKEIIIFKSHPDLPAKLTLLSLVFQSPRLDLNHPGISVSQLTQIQGPREQGFLASSPFC